MNFTVLALLLCGLTAACWGSPTTPAPCCVPLSFNGRLMYTSTSDNNTSEVRDEISFIIDFEMVRAYARHHGREPNGLPYNWELIALFGEDGAIYAVDRLKESCVKIPSTNRMSGRCMPADATFLGALSVGNGDVMVPALKYSFMRRALTQYKSAATVTQDKCLPLMEESTRQVELADVAETVLFYDMVKGHGDPRLFLLPKYCKDAEEDSALPHWSPAFAALGRMFFPDAFVEPCCGPAQYSADVVATAAFGRSTSQPLPGHISIDYTNQRASLRITGTTNNITITRNSSSAMLYVVKPSPSDPTTSACMVYNLPVFSLGTQCVHESSSIIDRMVMEPGNHILPTNLYMTEGLNALFKYGQYFSSDNCFPVMANIGTRKHRGGISTTLMLSDISDVAVVFDDPPKECAGKVPTVTPNVKSLLDEILHLEELKWLLKTLEDILDDSDVDDHSNHDDDDKDHEDSNCDDDALDVLKDFVRQKQGKHNNNGYDSDNLISAIGRRLLDNGDHRSDNDIKILDRVNKFLRDNDDDNNDDDNSSNDDESDKLHKRHRDNNDRDDSDDDNDGFDKDDDYTHRKKRNDKDNKGYNDNEDDNCDDNDEGHDSHKKNKHHKFDDDENEGDDDEKGHKRKMHNKSDSNDDDDDDHEANDDDREKRHKRDTHHDSESRDDDDDDHDNRNDDKEKRYKLRKYRDDSEDNDKAKDDDRKKQHKSSDDSDKDDDYDDEERHEKKNHRMNRDDSDDDDSDKDHKNKSDDDDDNEKKHENKKHHNDNHDDNCDDDDEKKHGEKNHNSDSDDGDHEENKHKKEKHHDSDTDDNDDNDDEDSDKDQRHGNKRHHESDYNDSDDDDDNEKKRRKEKSHKSDSDDDDKDKKDDDKDKKDDDKSDKQKRKQHRQSNSDEDDDNDDHDRDTLKKRRHQDSRNDDDDDKDDKNNDDNKDDRDDDNDDDEFHKLDKSSKLKILEEILDKIFGNSKSNYLVGIAQQFNTIIINDEDDESGATDLLKRILKSKVEDDEKDNYSLMDLYKKLKSNKKNDKKFDKHERDDNSDSSVIEIITEFLKELKKKDDNDEKRNDKGHKNSYIRKYRSSDDDKFGSKDSDSDDDKNQDNFKLKLGKSETIILSDLIKKLRAEN